MVHLLIRGVRPYDLLFTKILFATATATATEWMEMTLRVTPSQHTTIREVRKHFWSLNEPVFAQIGPKMSISTQKSPLDDFSVVADPTHAASGWK